MYRQFLAEYRGERRRREKEKNSRERERGRETEREREAERRTDRDREREGTKRERRTKRDGRGVSVRGERMKFAELHIAVVTFRPLPSPPTGEFIFSFLVLSYAFFASYMKGTGKKKEKKEKEI